VWALCLGALALLARGLRRPGAGRAVPALDPALAAVALASLAAMLWAVRLLWLAIFPLWAAAQGLRRRRPLTRRGPAWAAAALAVLLVPAFCRYGDWPLISQGVQRHTYSAPYPAAKYNAHAVWFLRDAGLAGNLWNDYASGNFLGYWLAPRLRAFVNGSLNLPRQAMRARQLIHYGGWDAQTPLGELLDRYRVDVFFGTGEPVASASSRGPVHTTTHLESLPGWTLVFRNLRSAVYLRADARNAANRERVAAYYASAGVPFDAERGFDVESVLREAPEWAIAHGVAPAGFGRLEALAHSLDPVRGPAARARLASLYLALGQYERAETLDRRQLQRDPGDAAAARRLVWSLLHQRRVQASLAAADVLEAIAPDGALARRLVDVARGQAAFSPEATAARVATLPVFTPWEGWQLLAGYRTPEARIPDR
jgi:hypothetical protein